MVIAYMIRFHHIYQPSVTQEMGMASLKSRLEEADKAEWFTGLFPATSVPDLRFAINFFWNIGLNFLTGEMIVVNNN